MTSIVFAAAQDLVGVTTVSAMLLGVTVAFLKGMEKTGDRIDAAADARVKAAEDARDQAREDEAAAWRRVRELEAERERLLQLLYGPGGTHGP